MVQCYYTNLGGNNMKKAYLKTGEFAFQMGVSQQTVMRWLKKGWIKYYKTPTGYNLIPVSEVSRLMGIEKEDEKE